MQNHQHSYSGSTKTSGDINKFDETNEQDGSAPSHTHGYSGWTSVPNIASTGAPSVASTGNMSANASHGHGNTGAPSTNATNTVNNIPVYYALCFIMKG